MTDNEQRIWYLLQRYAFGLREVEIAQELGWHRRTVNNHLRGLRSRGLAYKDGLCWLADRAN